MIHRVDLTISPDRIADEGFIRLNIQKALQLDSDANIEYRILKKSMDARHIPVYRLVLEVAIEEKLIARSTPVSYIQGDARKQVHIVGAGPAGLFCALKLLEHGIQPILIERGKTVRTRRKDLVQLTRYHKVDPDSNYCYGEGGAGTYSDGKLYTRSKKKGNVVSILEKLVGFGASSTILYEAHPHIGTNKLPKIIENIRRVIESNGGKYYFNERLHEVEIQAGKITRLITQTGKTFEPTRVVLATGHSATDIYRLLYEKGVKLEQKDFALGVRIEHPQQAIDKMQCGKHRFLFDLPPASYSLVDKQKERSAFSFCMCPGGVVAPCATNGEEIVTNGWSPSKRNNPFANAGIVVEIKAPDTQEFQKHGPLAGLYFRTSIEHKAWEIENKGLRAPAQLLVDFLADRPSKQLPKSSYLPGLKPVEMKDIFPEEITTSLRHALTNWIRRKPAFKHPNAVLIGVETRTSSPVRIPRIHDTFQHEEIENLYPVGEGAGYAGGIVSAAIDGENCAQKIVEQASKGHPIT
jgi:uncharacterized FAD-dependent dehydrogenase